MNDNRKKNKERQAHIARLLEKNERINVNQLFEILQVSKDLERSRWRTLRSPIISGSCLNTRKNAVSITARTVMNRAAPSFKPLTMG